MPLLKSSNIRYSIAAHDDKHKINDAGLALIKAIQLSGRGGINTPFFDSQKQGGFRSIDSVISADVPAFSIDGTTNYVLALGQMALNKQLKLNGHTWNDKTIIITDADTYSGPGTCLKIPFSELSSAEINQPTVGIGAMGYIMGLNLDEILAGYKHIFAEKATHLPKIEQAVKAGYEWAKEEYEQRGIIRPALPSGKIADNTILLNGNQAFAIGYHRLEEVSTPNGGKAKLMLVVYPITPSTDAADELLKNGFIQNGHAYIQASSEVDKGAHISGAALAARRDGTGFVLAVTSGPGLSLLAEHGSAAFHGIPFGILDVQRGGPGTGLPTKTSQSDYTLAVNLGHGGVKIPVFAPREINEIPGLLANAYNVAHKWDIPFVFLSDRALAATQMTVLENYFESWTLPNLPAHPFQNFTSLHSDSRTGLPIASTNLQAIEAETERLYARLDFIAKEGVILNPRPDLDFYAPPNTTNKGLCVFAWGSTYWSARLAVQKAAKEGINVQLVSTAQVYPFPDSTLAQLKGYRTIIVPEVAPVEQVPLELTWALQKRAGHYVPINSLLSKTYEPFTPAQIYQQIMKDA